ncbi:hypothetical protein EYF80_049942 [Liparis tanakae]|uniref:Uncharacterized protein n=1 Tax=Liparis tanakae TaxID=230148 RepID=A0A4Z2FFD6_9TELE|nr:hypothetical protein EYF80_049942 [Liparis tanakae]
MSRNRREDGRNLQRTPAHGETERGNTNPDESSRLCAGARQAVTVTVAAAERVSYRQPKRVGLTAVAVVSVNIRLK